MLCAGAGFYAVDHYEEKQKRRFQGQSSIPFCAFEYGLKGSRRRRLLQDEQARDALQIKAQDHQSKRNEQQAVHLVAAFIGQVGYENIAAENEEDKSADGRRFPEKE